MFRSINSALLAAVLGFCAQAQAVIPEPGMWWNPAESGRGYGIELQDDGIFVTYYGFQPNGVQSAFFTTFGRLNSDTGRMTGYWASATNGQCFGCPYRAPTLGDQGQATFEFTSPTTGQILLPGGIVIPIQRQIYMANSLSDPNIMLGIWTFVDGSLGIYFGEILWFQDLDTSVSGGFRGRRVDGAASRVALGGLTDNPSLPRWLVLLDSSSTHYTAYAFNNSVDTLIGRSWTYRKGTSLTGAGLPSIGKRMMGNTLAEQAADSQQGVLKTDPNLDMSATLDAKADASTAGTTPESIVIEGKSYSMSAIQAEIARLQAEIEAQ